MLHATVNSNGNRLSHVEVTVAQIVLLSPFLKQAAGIGGLDHKTALLIL